MRHIKHGRKKFFTNNSCFMFYIYLILITNNYQKKAYVSRQIKAKCKAVIILFSIFLKSLESTETQAEFQRRFRKSQYQVGRALRKSSQLVICTRHPSLCSSDFNSFRCPIQILLCSLQSPCRSF